MADWTGEDYSTESMYRAMAELSLQGVSPSYERLCLGVADDPAVLALLAELPTPKRQPNLLLGAVRFLGGPIGTYAGFRSWLLAQWSDVAALMRQRRTQTNEPGRCATLLPLLAALPQPLALIEVGASAGLCLYPDRYAYRFATPSGAHDIRSHEVGSSTLTLECAVTGAVPLPAAVPQVAWRGGLDLNPLDVASSDDVRWLEALVWPEQTERCATLHAAVEIARTDPVRIRRGDLLADLPELVEAAEVAAPGATPVVFHSAVLAYVGAAGRAAFAVTMRALAGSHGVVWVSNEAPGVVPGTELDSGETARFVLARDGVPLALTGPHGHTLDWLTD
jgi:hypothetical protein